MLNRPIEKPGKYVPSTKLSPRGRGYCAGLRKDGTASRKAQSRAKHNFQCVKFVEVPPERWGVTTLVKGAR